MFINRERDRKMLFSALTKNTQTGHLILVSGKRGYGKSSLIKKVFEDNELEYIAIESSEEEIKSTINKGLYIKMLCAQILRKLPDNALEVFLRGSHIEESTVEIILNGVSDWLGFGQAVEKYYQSQKELPKAVNNYVFDDLHILSICFNFIEYFFSKNSVYLFVENFHRIDDFSLNALVKMLASNPNARITGEFLDSAEIKLGEFMHNLSDKIEKSVLLIDKIQKEDLINSLLGNQLLLRNLIVNTYDDSGGNLKQFSLAYKTNHLDYRIDHFDRILSSTLESLDSSYRFLIISVYCHRSAVSQILLEKYIKHFSSQNQNLTVTSIEVLRNMKLLKYLDGRLQLAHDSLCEEIIKLPDYNKLALISNRNWLRMYKFICDNKLNGRRGNFSNYSMQLYFLSALKDFGEINILFSKILSALSGQSIFEITPILKEIESIYFESKFEEKDSYVAEWLIRLYYKCGMLHRVIELYTELEPYRKAEFIGYYLTSKSSIGANSEVKSNITRINKAVDDLHTQLVCRLVLIRSLRSSYEILRAKAIWLETIRSQMFVNSCFEADILRFVVLVEHEDYNLRIEYLHKAVVIYERNRNFTGLLNAYMDLSRDYLFTDDIVSSRCYMRKATEIAYSTLSPRYIHFNNKSVLAILERESFGEIKFLLESILVVCENEDDRKIIANNLIVHCVLSADSTIHEFLNSIERELILEFSMKSETDFRLLYNIWQARIRFGLEITIDYERIYFSKMRLIKNKIIWQYLLGESSKNPFPQILKEKLYPCFLVNWNIDYYNALNNFQ